MKILMITPGRLPIPAVKGGAVESLIEMLINYNEKHVHYNMKVVSIYDEDAEKKSREYQYNTFEFLKMGKAFSFFMSHHLLPYRLLDYFFSRKAVRILKKKKESYDYIVIQNETVNGSVFQKMLPGRYLYHAHNDIVTSVKAQEIEFLKSCEKVISISQYLSDKIQKDYSLDNLTTVYNGIDTDLFDPKKNEKNREKLRKQYGIHEEDVVVVFSGRMVQEKGVKELLEAFLLLPKELSVKILIIGSSFFGADKDNPYMKHLKNLCQSRQSDIIFTGYVKYQNMPEYYAMADIGCIPSIWDEPFGLTVVEQMAMELPIITTDAGAIPEIVNSACGYILKRDADLCENIASSIRKMYENKELRIQMGKNGRNIVCSRFGQNIFCESWFQTVVCDQNGV